MFHAEGTLHDGWGLDFGGEEKGEFPKPLLNALVNISLPLARLGSSQQGRGVVLLKLVVGWSLCILALHGLGCRGGSMTQGWMVLQGWHA